MPPYIPALTLAALVGSGLISGLLFAFSTTVMRSLSDLPPASGMAAMQRINVRILNPTFLLLFLGTAAACGLLLGLCIWHGAWPWAAAGAVCYLVGPFGLTAAVHVPLNERLARRRPEEAPEAWPAYVNSWLMWNHVRTGLGAGATALLGYGLLGMGL